ncbi:MAG: hypothetical protein HY928_15260 [Elusimicrobia bacterium]|nr:hypothetical protein [Elusimicrobiota bacterium]
MALNATAGEVARLDGRTIVTDADIAGWSAAQACYGEGALTSRKAAFMRLTEAAVADKAMRGHGGPVIDDKAVAEDAARIDKETQAPDILACIKAALGADFQRVFVRPSLIESRLRLFLMRDARVQAPARAKAALARRRALEGSGLESAAKELGLHYSSASYSAGPEPIGALLAGTPQGKFLDEPFETDYVFQAVRLLHKDGKGGTFEAATVRKAGQDEWFGSLPKMTLEIYDDGLREWAAGLKGNPRLTAVEIKKGATR